MAGARTDSTTLDIVGRYTHRVAISNLCLGIMEAALKEAGVTVKLVRVPGGDHGPNFPGHTQAMDWPGMVVEWFDASLKKKP